MPQFYDAAPRNASTVGEEIARLPISKLIIEIGDWMEFGRWLETETRSKMLSKHLEVGMMNTRDILLFYSVF